jgi:hypothetical protein
VDLFLVISQGIGVSIAAGIRALLPALLVGALARADLGVDFSGTDYAFLESVGWLAALVVAAALLVLVGRSRATLPLLMVSVVAIAIGALEFAGSLSDEGYASGPGLVAGAACALIGAAAARAFFGRAASRVRGGDDQAEAASFVELYAQGVAVAAAGLAVLVPPASYLVLCLCSWVLVVRRRAASRKYEGLRVLR